MDDADLEGLLLDIESDRVERKAALSDRGAVEEAVCAFANDLPGHGRPGIVFIGASDDGTPSRLQITDRLLQNLASIRPDGNILPVPSVTVQKRHLRGADMAVVIVEPSGSPPVRLRGRVHVRVGPRRAIASPEEERRLAERRRGRDLPFDSRPVPGATLDDLNLGLFTQEYLPSAIAPDVLAENQRSTEQQLATLRLATLEGVPTAAGILMVGKDPLDFLPGAYIQFLRVDGVDLSAPIKDEKKIAGPLPQAIHEAEEILRLSISTRVTLTATGAEERRPDLPFVALQQVLRNAVIHRTYEGSNAPVRATWLSDRIEISSPGGPYGQVTVETFGRPGLTDYRNPTIAEALRAIGFVQRFGVGIQLARSSLEGNGNPPLEYEVQPTYIGATMRALP